jgi:serine/threonine protein kinase
VGGGADLVLPAYLLLEPIGEGGNGRVFTARHRQIQRLVALKIIRPELVTDRELMARFYREIQVISQLAHSHIVHAYTAGPVGATHFLAMKYVEGTDLSRLVREMGPLPVPLACDYVDLASPAPSIFPRFPADR